MNAPLSDNICIFIPGFSKTIDLENMSIFYIYGKTNLYMHNPPYRILELIQAVER